MASPQLDMIIQMFRAQPFDTSIPIAETRLSMEEGFRAMLPVPADIKREPVDAGGVPAEWFTAPNSTDTITILYLHGGGYVIGSINTHADLTGRLARATGGRVLSLDYRLAPEHPHPAAVDDATAAYRWLLKQSVRPETIVIAGDSAGGGLTAATLLALKQSGDPLPGAAVLLSPWTDLAATGESVKTREAVDPIINPAMIAVWAPLYYTTTPSTDPLVSPLYGDYSGLPPILIIVGDAEVLLDDSRRYAERARAAGVDVTIEVWDEMIHVFPIFAPLLPEGQQAIDRIGEWVKQKVAAGAAA